MIPDIEALDAPRFDTLDPRNVRVRNTMIQVMVGAKGLAGLTVNVDLGA